jgi:hypothetical protein
MEVGPVNPFLITASSQDRIPLNAFKACNRGITYGQAANKSFVSRRRSKFAGHAPLCGAYIALRF